MSAGQPSEPSWLCELEMTAPAVASPPFFPTLQRHGCGPPASPSGNGGQRRPGGTQRQLRRTSGTGRRQRYSLRRGLRRSRRPPVTGGGCGGRLRPAVSGCGGLRRHMCSLQPGLVPHGPTPRTGACLLAPGLANRRFQCRRWCCGGPGVRQRRDRHGQSGQGGQEW